MNYFCGVVLAVSLFMVVSTEPLDLGDRVWKALEEKGIGREKLAQMVAAEEKDVKDNVGDIWSDCGGSGDIGKIVKVTITPDPPQKGQDLTVEADMTLSETVTNGTIQVKLQYYVFGLPISVIDESLPICGTETGLTCPLTAGDQNLKFAQEVPSTAPGGKYTGSAVATSSNGKQIVCIDLEFNL